MKLPTVTITGGVGPMNVMSLNDLVIGEESKEYVISEAKLSEIGANTVNDDNSNTERNID